MRAFILTFVFFPWMLQAGQMEHLRNTRYCEILTTRNFSDWAVYNTIGLNDCPADIWNKLSSSSIKKQTQTRMVRLNGPRYWVIDGLTNSKTINPTVQTIDGLQVREAGILHINPLVVLWGAKPYRTKIVDRSTTWIFKTHKRVYELIDPEGHVFVMQSYSVQQSPQTLQSLKHLGEKLHLPKGWQFTTGLLKSDTYLKAIDNKATVLQDEFDNTYQLATKDFFKID